jgi:8-oxo-dGTP pyrophosphatase MutT (NUDIX family)
VATKKSAIIPYRIEDGEIRVLLVTTSSGGKWVIPKGGIEAPLKPHISATKEAFEEAGVLGRPHPIRVGKYSDSSSDGPIPTFLLEVEVELDDKAWQEEYKRKRKWVNADNCDKYITDSDLLDVLNKGIRCLRSDGAYFRRAIKTYCEELNWKISELDEDHAILEFRMPSKRSRSMYIVRYDSTIEFSVPSLASFSSEEELPEDISRILLQRNSEKKIGFWCIDRINEKFVYSHMHNVELKLLDSRYFAQLVQGLINECDAIEGFIETLPDF